MKKLMFAMAAVAAGAVFAEEGIVSANIVGYQNSGIKPLTSIGVNSFTPVSGDPVDIQEFKVTVTEGDLYSGQVMIQTLTSGGATDKTYSWILPKDGEEYGFPEGVGGWYDNNEFGPATDVTFADGVGFVFDNQADESAKFYITYAGEVISGATDIPVALLTTVSGNMTPVARDIQRFAVTNDVSATIYSGQVMIQTLTSGGATDKTYSWILPEDGEEYGFPKGVGGWYDNNEFGPATDIEFAAGEGFVIDNQAEYEAILRVPSPLE